MTDQTKIKITAVDEFSSVLGKMSESVGGLVGRVGSLQAAFAGIAGVGVLTGLATSVKQAIDTADALDELSQKTGIAVKELSALDYAFRREGVSTEALGSAVKKLSGNMVEAGDATSKAGRLFREFGIDAKGSTQEALLKLADVFQKLPDGATKSALAVELLGKAGTDLIPAFNNGRAGIEALTQQAEKLGLVIDENLAQQSAKFNDNLFAINESGKKLGITLANQTLPALNDIVEAMTRGIEKGGLLTGVLEGLRAGFSRVVFGDQVENAAAEIGRLENLIAQLERDSVTASGAQLQGILDGISQLQVELKKARDLYDGLTTGQGNQAPKVATDAGLEEKVRQQLGKQTDALKESQSAYEQIVAVIRKKIEQQTIELEKGRKLNEEEQFRAQINELLAQKESKVSTELQKSVQIYTDSAVALIRENEARKARLALLQSELDGEAAALASLERNRAIGIDVENALIRSNKEREFEVSLIGKTSEEIEILRLARQKEKDLLKATSPEQRERIENLYAEAEAQVRNRQSLEQTANTFASLQNIGANFFSDLFLNGKKAFDNLTQSLKRFAADLIATFAKKYILNLAGGQDPLSALSGANSGGGFSNPLNSLFGMGNSTIGPGQGSLIAIAAAAQYAIGQRAFSGNRAAQQASAFGLLPGAIVNLLTGGSRENQNFRLLQGTGGEGLFGGLNIEGTYGFDLSALRTSTGRLDSRLARVLGGRAGEGAAALAAYTAAGLRADGQPAQFAFPEGDQTAAEQIAKELLQSRYGTLFGLIDQKIADQIKNFAGTSTELEAFITQTLSIFEALDGTKIKGLNIDSLRELAGPDGDLAQVLQGLTQNVGALIDEFSSEDQKLAAARQAVADAFAALGVAAPQTRQQFLDLVNSIDLSTDAGRQLYNTLVSVAPAFSTVASAAEAMAKRFQSALAAIFGSSVGRANIENQATPLVRRFQELTGLLPGLDPLSVFKGIGNALPSDIQAIFDTFGDEVDGLLTQLLELYASYISLTDATGEVTGGLRDLTGGLGSVVDALGDARRNLREYLVGSLLDRNLSPLSVGQQFNVAQSEFQRLLGLAQGGDVGAINSLGGARDQLLELGRILFASSGNYNNLFNTTFDQLKTISGATDISWQSQWVSALPAQGQKLASSADVQELNASITLLLKSIADGQTQQTAQAAADARRIAAEIVQAQQTGGAFAA